jgi:hypothetical protein
MRGRMIAALLVAFASSACGSDGAAPASSPAPISKKPAPVLGDPLDAPKSEEWVWIPVEGTQCADGTEAGVGVNFTSQSRNLVVWFQGNGVCYNQTTCTLFQGLLTGMGPDPLDHLWWGDKNTPHLGIFDRNDPENPFREDNIVAFPHCGVDGHTADKDTTYGSLTVHQHGYSNVAQALPRIMATFQDATRVVVAGFSAGGIGAGANYHQIATGFEALGMPSPFLIVDAGPILPPPYATELATTSLRDGWGTDRTIDTWCSTCATEGYHTAYREIARMHPGLRSAIVSAYADGVATPLYSLLNADSTFDGAKFEAGLRELAVFTDSYQDAVSPSVHREFYYGGTRHGALVVAGLAATPGLSAFLNDQLNDAPNWTTIEP